MKNLQEATERICDLKGSLISIDAFLPSILEALPPSTYDGVARVFEKLAESARTVILHSTISDHAVAAFERDTARTRALLAGYQASASCAEPRSTPDDVLLTVAPLTVFAAEHPLGRASGFFFLRDGRLFLVTNRHVVIDEVSGHYPDRIEIEFHTELADMTRCTNHSVPLYGAQRRERWRQIGDTTGTPDVVAIELDPSAMPSPCVMRAFGPQDLEPRGEDVQIGDALAIIGFPPGLHDTVNRLAVACGASIASAYGVPFRRQRCFLTDARGLREIDGAPVLRRRTARACENSALPWQLLGVHSTRSMAGGSSDVLHIDSPLSTCAWHADVVMALTDSPTRESAADRRPGPRGDGATLA